MRPKHAVITAEVVVAIVVLVGGAIGCGAAWRVIRDLTLPVFVVSAVIFGVTVRSLTNRHVARRARIWHAELIDVVQRRLG